MKVDRLFAKKSATLRRLFAVASAYCLVLTTYYPMFSPRFRFFLIILLLVSGTAAVFVYFAWAAAGILWATAALLLYGHFRHGTIIPALWALRKGDVERAGEQLALIKRPEWLTRRYRAYYFFAMGLVGFYHKRFEDGANFLKEAIQQGLSGKNELAIAYLNLAHAAFLQKNYAEAQEFLEKTTQAGSDDLYLKQRVEELQQALLKSEK